jgi:2-phosphosulfolactate phosphatase
MVSREAAGGGPHAQGGVRVRFDWGPVGAEAIGAGAAIVAVVDVLSFTTTVTVAVERGMAVLPYRWRDDSAVEVARRHDAVLAVGRSRAGPGQVSLSPASVLASQGIERLVLPSPNGSTIAAGLAGTGATVVGVCLRNATAAATWARKHLSDLGPGDERLGDGVVAVIAAGERWPDGSLRPAVEDLWGAGAFIHALGWGGLSAEAGAARAAYREVAGGLAGALGDCASGRELVGQGFGGDVAVAAQVDASVAVPVLRDGWFAADSVKQRR